MKTKLDEIREAIEGINGEIYLKTIKKYLPRVLWTAIPDLLSQLEARDAEIKELQGWIEEMKMTADRKYDRIQKHYKEMKERAKDINAEDMFEEGYAMYSGAWAWFILWLEDRKHIQEAQEYWASNREKQLAREISNPTRPEA